MDAQFIKERLDFIEKEYRTTLDSLSMAISISDFQESINKLDEPDVILEESAKRLRCLVDFKSIGFFLVDEKNSDYVLKFCDPETNRQYFQDEINVLIEDGTFSWALNEMHPVIVGAKNGRDEIMLHVMATVTRIRGMFIGVLAQKPKTISESILYVISLVMNNTANALESYELYNQLRSANHVLQAEVIQRKKVEKDLQASLERYDIAIKGVQDGLWDFDFVKGKAYFSPQLAEMFGYMPESLKHYYHEFETRLHPDDRNKALLAFKNHLDRKGPYDIEFRLLTRSNIYSWFSAKGQAVWDKNGQVLRMAGSIRDITDRKMLEEQLHQAHKMESIGTLAGGVAHDFNNILAIILSNVDLALYGDKGSFDPKQYLNNIKKASLRARDLVKQILTFSRKAEAEKEVVNVGPFLTGSMRLIRSSIPSSIVITENINLAKVSIVANPTQLTQILLNLCANAAHSMNFEGCLEVSADLVDLDPNEFKHSEDITPGPYIMISVRDTGCGIDPKYKDRIFDPYFTTKKIGEGSGLGLSVVYGIVKSHNGKIKVNSELNKGTQVSVYLPMVKDKPRTGASERDQLTVGTGRILLVDDDKALVDLGKLMLETLGFEVVGMADPKAAITLFRENPNDFDLIISDMTMPVLTGDLLARQMLEIQKDIPIIIVTGHHDSMNPQIAREIGIKKLLMKPFTLETLARVVSEVLA